MAKFMCLFLAVLAVQCTLEVDATYNRYRPRSGKLTEVQVCSVCACEYIESVMML